LCPTATGGCVYLYTLERLALEDSNSDLIVQGEDCMYRSHGCLRGSVFEVSTWGSVLLGYKWRRHNRMQCFPKRKSSNAAVLMLYI